MKATDPLAFENALRRLCLYHTLRHAGELLEAAAKENLSHRAFLERILDEEMAFRFFQLDFIDKHEHLIFLGSGGLGKTHLATALGFAACQREYKTLFTTAADMINHLVASQADHSLDRALRRYTGPKLLIIDELGYLPLDKQGRDLFFQVISKRSQVGSMILTTNKPFKDWGEVFQDTAVASAIAERLIEHGELIKIEGASYRVTKKRQKNLGLDGLNEKK